MPESNRVAPAVLREVPIGKLSSFIKTIKPGVEVAMGDGCGGGCGGGAGCIDQFGHSGIDQDVFSKALHNKTALTAALQTEVKTALTRL